MKFEFDTTADGAKEAAALVTSLSMLFGGSILESIDRAADRLDADPKASDGYRVAASALMPTSETVTVTEEPSAASAFGTPTPAEGVTLDTAGVPWHEKIHASTKTTNKDGTWSRRRNTPDEVYEQVMAQLKSGAAPLQAPPPPPAPTAAVIPPPPPPPAAPAETVVPPPPATSTPAASTTSDEPITFPKFMVKVTRLQMAQKITVEKVTEILGNFGLSAAKELASASPEIVAAVSAMVDDYVGA